MRQLFTTLPSITTEHAPHSPSPHPSLVPVLPKSSRSTSSSRRAPSVSTLTAAPFSVNRVITPSYAFPRLLTPLGFFPASPGFRRARPRSHRESPPRPPAPARSEEHTSELQSRFGISYAVS